MAAWDLGFHTKRLSRVAPGFKLSHLCPHGQLGIDGGGMAMGEEMGSLLPLSASRVDKQCCWELLGFPRVGLSRGFQRWI